MQTLEERILAIEERNQKVEMDKKWETSVFRRVVIFVMTYVIACIAFVAYGSKNPLLDASIPSLGFLLSTLSLPWIRRLWEHVHENANE